MLKGDGEESNGEVKVLNGDGKAVDMVEGDEESLKGDHETLNHDGKALKGNGEDIKCDGWACDGEEKVVETTESC